MRSIAELRDVPEPAWPALQAAIARANQRVAVLPADPNRAEVTLLQLQVTARSTLGALALHTGGLMIDNGWLRLLGGGEPPLNLAIANDLKEPPGAAPGRLIVAVDVLGGKFAVNGGGLPGRPGDVCYFAPDELGWVPLGMGHGSFVAWSMTDQMAVFYEHLRWPGWETEVSGLAPDQGLSLYPFPFTKEGQDLSRVSRKPAPIAELLTLWEHSALQLEGVAEGGQFLVGGHGEA